MPSTEKPYRVICRKHGINQVASNRSIAIQEAARHNQTFHTNNDTKDWMTYKAAN